jgi:hypothetical protein
MVGIAGPIPVALTIQISNKTTFYIRRLGVFAVQVEGESRSAGDFAVVKLGAWVNATEA